MRPEEAEQQLCKQDLDKRQARGSLGEFEDDGETLGQQADLEHVMRQREEHTNCRSLECLAHAGRFQESTGQLQIQVQCVQGNGTGRAPFWSLRVCRPERQFFFTENEPVPVEACQNRLARRRFAKTRRNWDSEPKRQHISNKEVPRRYRTVPIAMGLRIRRVGWANRMAEQNQMNDCSHQQVLATNFGQTRLDKSPCMTSEGKLTMLHSMGKALSGWYRSPGGNLTEGDHFVSETNGDFRKAFFLHAESFCPHDFNVIRARYWSRAVPPPGKCQKLCGKCLRKKRTKRTSADVGQKGREVH